MYRQFYLTNAEGSVWQLTEQSFKAYLNAPQGLGQSETLVTTVYGEVAKVIDEDFSFPQVTGEMLFYDDANSNRYQKYNDFARFISHTPLTLWYVIPTNPTDAYSLPCYCVSLNKSETGRDAILACEVAFQGLDFWNGEEVTITGTLTPTITNDGDYPVGFEITLETVGVAFTNPSITIEQDGEVYGEARFTDATAFDYVYVNSKDSEQNAILKQNGVEVPSPLGYQDLSISDGKKYVTFIKLARGTSTMTISVDSGIITGVTIKFTPKYRSV